jgi:hypothetical protein
MGSVGGGFIAALLFILTPVVEYAPVGMLVGGARYGRASTRKARRGTEKHKKPH